MARIIVGRFSSYQDAINTMNELARQNVDKDRMSLVAPRPPDAEDPSEETVQGDPTNFSGGVGAMALAGAATVGLWGAGAALVAGPLAALAAAQMGEEDEDNEENRRFQRLLTGANIAASAQDAQAYIDDVRAGSTILAVEVTDQQEDMASAVFHRHGGGGLTYRRVNA